MNTTITLPYFSIILAKELESRKLSNGQYSLRGFARDLNIHPAVLSLAMKGKRLLPNRDAESALGKLKLNPEEELLFKRSLSPIKS